MSQENVQLYTASVSPPCAGCVSPAALTPRGTPGLAGERDQAETAPSIGALYYVVEITGDPRLAAGFLARAGVQSVHDGASRKATAWVSAPDADAALDRVRAALPADFTVVGAQPE